MISPFSSYACSSNTICNAETEVEVVGDRDFPGHENILGQGILGDEPG
jgi:hypothetical protein